MSGILLRNKTTPRTAILKEAVIAAFSISREEGELRLSEYFEADWESVLWWLDISGMALYFLDRMQHLGLQHLIPPGVENALTRRLQKNQLRVRALHEEAAVLAGWFRMGRVEYALLKGASLTPDSVPSSALRIQVDLDLLVSRRSAVHAIHYIHRLGYRLHARNESTLEFRAGESAAPDIVNLYSVQTERALELHVFADQGNQPNQVTRRVTRLIAGTEFDTLSGPDILVQQSRHLLKHLCSEHTRLSWVLEFRRHVEARIGDHHFWQDVYTIAANEHNGDLAMGVALWTAERMFGPLDQAPLRRWQRQTLPPRIRLWLERYVHDLLLADSAGTKLYALLQSEVPCTPSARRSTRNILFPHYLPARIMKPRPDETWRERWERLEIEFGFFFRRLHFHLTQGIRFAIESARWKRALVRCGQ